MHVERPAGLPEVAAGLADGQLATARALALRALADGAPAAADGLVCECALALPGTAATGCSGWIAVYAPAVSAAAAADTAGA